VRKAARRGPTEEVGQKRSGRRGTPEHGDRVDRSVALQIYLAIGLLIRD
jgi:hypothetical protein